jgi:hypothetical protein
MTASKGGVLQATITGNGNAIFNAVTQGGRLLPSGRRFCQGSVTAFAAEVRAALLRTVELPESAPVYAGEFRRLLVRKFDHGIFYRIHGARIVVTAVLDLRQDPTTIRRRLNL